MNVLGIIPARYASTRFPGKPLAIIAGKAMIERVYRQTEQALKYTVVATDDEKIYNFVKEFKGQVLMTSTKHTSGTERCAEALEYAKKKFKVNFSHVVNIQGDEPFIKPQQILQLTEVLKDKKVEIATLAQKITDKNQLFDNNVVKLVFSHSNKAIYFSRATIPFIRGKKTNEWFEQTDFYKHIGIYAYRSDILPKLPLLKKHPLEIFESLEQNRWLANDLVIKVALTKYESPSVDTPDDLKYIEKLINTGEITIK